MSTIPTPGNVSPWYLRNINQALALDANGNVYLRTLSTDSEIDVNIARINNTAITGSSLPANITSLGSVIISGSSLPVSGNVGITSVGSITVGSSLPVSGDVGIIKVGSVTVGTTLPVSGSVSITGTTLGSVPIDGSTLPVSGNVSITSLGSVVISGTSLPVSGNVSITSLGSVPINGTTLPVTVVTGATGIPTTYGHVINTANTSITANTATAVLSILTTTTPATPIIVMPSQIEVFLTKSSAYGKFELIEGGYGGAYDPITGSKVSYTHIPSSANAVAAGKVVYSGLIAGLTRIDLPDDLKRALKLKGATVPLTLVITCSEASVPIQYKLSWFE